MMRSSEDLEQIEKAKMMAKSSGDRRLEKSIRIIQDFIKSQKSPNMFRASHREDLRKLAKEIGYDQETKFETWLESRK